MSDQSLTESTHIDAARMALDDLSATERTAFEALLRSDAALASETAALQRALRQLPFAAARTPPADLRERVLAAVRAKHHAPRARTRTAWWSLVSFATAASVVCAVLLVERAQLRRQLELETQAATMLREPNIVKSFSLRGGARVAGVVLLDLDAKRASIALRDMPPLAPGQAYHLWAVLEENKRVPCGRFLPADNGQVLMQFDIPVDSYTSPIQKLILTIDADRELHEPAGRVVLTT